MVAEYKAMTFEEPVQETPNPEPFMEPAIVSDEFWGEELSVLFDPTRLVEFIPTPDMSYAEKLNAVSRFSVITAVALSLWNRSSLYLSIAMIVLLIVWLLYIPGPENVTKGLENKTFDREDNECTMPTENNPFMNVRADEYKYNPDRPAACPINQVDNEIKYLFNKNVPKDENDLWDHNNSQRQFYSMPVTTIPNEQGKFANWLYGQDQVCKDGDYKVCTGYEA